MVRGERKKGQEVKRLEECLSAMVSPSWLESLEREAETNRAKREAWELVALMAELEQELEDLRERTARHIGRAGDDVAELDRVTRLAKQSLATSWKLRKVVRLVK